MQTLVRVGFEPTPPKRLRPERSALDHSATSPCSEKCLEAIGHVTSPQHPSRRPHAFQIPSPTTPVQFRLRSPASWCSGSTSDSKSDNGGSIPSEVNFMSLCLIIFVSSSWQRKNPTPAWIRTRVARFKVWSADHYTTGAPCSNIPHGAVGSASGC